MSNPSEEARFRAAVPKSMHAVEAWAAYLRRKGLEVVVHQVEVRPTFEQREAYGDTWDVKGRRNGGRWLRFEVKGRAFAFTGRQDFPFPSVVADRANKKSAPADWYVTLSKDLCYAAVMEGAQRDQWETATIYDRTKGYPCPVYLCPVSLVHFLRL